MHISHSTEFFVVVWFFFPPPESIHWSYSEGFCRVLQSKPWSASPLSRVNSTWQGDCTREGSIPFCWRGRSTCSLTAASHSTGLPMPWGRQTPLPAQLCAWHKAHLSYTWRGEWEADLSTSQSQTPKLSNLLLTTPGTLQLPAPLKHQQIPALRNQIPSRLLNTDSCAGRKGFLTPATSPLAESTC